jgi:Family of unknown function (DUF6069)
MTTTQIPRTARVTVENAEPRPPLRRVAGRSTVAAGAGAAVLLGYGALAVAAHGPMQVGDPGHTTPINAASFAIGVLFSSFFGIVLAVVLARWAKHPARTFGRVAVALTAISLWAPYTAQTDDATKLLLAGGHALAAIVIVPLIVRALRTRLV